MLSQKVQEIKSGKLSATGNIKQFLEKIEKENKKFNIVLQVNEEALAEAKKVDAKIKQGTAGKFAGLGFLVKSNINVAGLICNCASKTLENYRAGYDATVIAKLKGEDAIVLGMVNMDEFACGGTGENSAFGVCKNPSTMSRIPGGSSSGSAAGVAAGFCDFALGSDTGGSVRNPASHCGVVGLKPSYGMVSRYGLIDLAMSFDQIGPLTYSVADCQLVFDVIKGADEHDGVSQTFEKGKERKGKISVGVLSVAADERILDLIAQKIEAVKKPNWIFKQLTISHINLGIQTYYPLAYVEFFSGTRKFDGRKYGKKIEEVCGKEVLRRILGGSEISKAEFAEKYYRRALAAKKIIAQEFSDAFKQVDMIILPTVPKLPHKIGEKLSVEDEYRYDTLTVLANLAQIPAISVPAGTISEDGEKIPIGLQIMAARGNDDLLLAFAKNFE